MEGWKAAGKEEDQNTRWIDSLKATTGLSLQELSSREHKNSNDMTVEPVRCNTEQDAGDLDSNPHLPMEIRGEVVLVK